MRKLPILILLAVAFVSCAPKGAGDLRDVLTHKELKTANAMVSEYDRFISLQLHDQNMPVEKAYATYLQFNAPFAKVALEGDNFKPDPSRIIDVIAELGVKNVKKFLIFNPSCTELHISKDGSYLDILRKLAQKRDIYARMYENAKSSDGPYIDGDWLVIDEFGSIDFRNRAERLVFLLNVFTFAPIPKVL